MGVSPVSDQWPRKMHSSIEARWAMRSASSTFSSMKVTAMPCAGLVSVNSVLSEERAEAGKAIADAASAEGVPQGRRVDGDDGLAEPALGLIGQPYHGEVGASLH